MDQWLASLRRDLAGLEEDDLLRKLVAVEPHGRTITRGDQTLLNLAGNDYLALSNHPRLRDAATDAIRRFGVGAAASRLVSGHQVIHQQVETRFARFKHAQAALLCPTGYTAAHATVTALAGRGDLICIDKLTHASFIDAARASGADLRICPHRNLAKLKRLLSATDKRRKFIITDSVFSMDGDCADLPALCDLAEPYDAVLIVDEAHATGVLGDDGAGLCQLQGVTDRVAVVVSTASKALGALGGIITARREVIATIVNRARSFIYTTGAMPLQAAAVAAALDVIRDEPQRRRRLQSISQSLRRSLRNLGHDVDTDGPATPIIPLIVGSARAALEISQQLEHQGIFTPAIRPPSVAPGAARVRLSLRCDLTDSDLDQIIRAIATCKITTDAVSAT